MTRKLLILLVVFTALSAGGQETQSVLMLDAGYASVHDSYLTPITYDGVDLALSVEAVRPMRQGQWLWQLNVGADYNFVENPSKNNDLHKLMGDIAFDMQRCWKGVFNPKLNLSAGPMAQLRAGIVYDEVNSNNPVTVRAHANVGATGMAWFNTRLGRKPITLRYRSTPAWGASPLRCDTSCSCPWQAYFSLPSMTRATTRSTWATTRTWPIWAGGETAWT